MVDVLGLTRKYYHPCNHNQIPRLTVITLMAQEMMGQFTLVHVATWHCCSQQNRWHTSISPKNMRPKSAIRIAKPFINPPLKSPQSSLNSHYVNQPCWGLNPANFFCFRRRHGSEPPTAAWCGVLDEVMKPESERKLPNQLPIVDFYTVNIQQICSNISNAVWVSSTVSDHLNMWTERHRETSQKRWEQKTSVGMRRQTLDTPTPVSCSYSAVTAVTQKIAMILHLWLRTTCLNRSCGKPLYGELLQLSISDSLMTHVY